MDRSVLLAGSRSMTRIDSGRKPTPSFRRRPESRRTSSLSFMRRTASSFRRRPESRSAPSPFDLSTCQPNSIPQFPRGVSSGGCPLLIAGLILGCLSVLCLPRPAPACQSDQYNSIHFNSDRPDFGTVPRRAILSWHRVEGNDDRGTSEYGGNGADRTGMELTEDQDKQRHDARLANRQRLMETALALAKKGALRKSIGAYRQVGARYGWWGGVRDRVEVLQGALASPATPVSFLWVRVYLRAMELDDAGKRDRARQAFTDIVATADPRTAAPVLPHALYQLASLEYEDHQLPAALALYEKVLGRFPTSPVREQALLMIARCTLLGPKPTAADITDGASALDRLQTLFPNTRFRGAFTGLRARVDFLRGHYARASHIYFSLGDLDSNEMILRKTISPDLRDEIVVRLFAAYLRSLDTAQDYATYEHAVQYADLNRDRLSTAAARRFSAMALADPDLAASYFYYRLYLVKNTRSETRQLADFAARVADRHPFRHDSPGARLVLTRIAEVFYQDGAYSKALRWSNESLASGVSDRALYVRGACEEKQHRLASAGQDFTRLLRQFPLSPLERVAREELALVDEARGDLGGALDQYCALGYTGDIAFFLDARMTPRQIERYLAGRPYPGYRSLITYSLGIRYLRTGQWDRARRWLERTPAEKEAEYSQGRKEWAARPSPDPLVAVSDLESLQRAVSRAKGSNARAEALYRYASYYYSHGSLLLYNAGLWQQMREYSFDIWWNERHATPQDLSAERDHMYEHEVYARALRICLDIEKRYPRSPTAPRALYRAACCARYLANYNYWWRKEDKRHDYWAESVHLMTRLANRYPTDPLAAHARKYAGVFAQEGRDERQYGM